MGYVEKFKETIERNREEELRKHHSPSHSLRALVVDDEQTVRDTLTICLTINGHTVETATDGLEGLEKFRAGEFDVVITDRRMPYMSGDKLATGALTKMAFMLWLLNALFFSSSIFYVKLRVEEHVRKNQLRSLRDRLTISRGCIIYHLLLLVFIGTLCFLK